MIRLVRAYAVAAALVGGEEAPPPVPELLTRGDRPKGAEA
jgi:hypothetical protein